MHRKEFDTWNIQKKIVDTLTTKRYHERDVWWCSLGLNVGFEQDGTGREYQRPVLVIKGISKDVCFVLPLTTSLSQNKNRIPVGIVDGKHASAIISQLRLIDTRRLVNKIAVVDAALFQEIRNAVRRLF